MFLVAVHRVRAVARQVSGDGPAAHVATTTGGHDLDHPRAEHSHRDETSPDGMTTGQGRRRRDGTVISTTLIPAPRDHATGLHHQESAMYPQLGAGAYARPFVRAGTKSRAPGPPRRYSPARDTRDTRDYRRRSPSPRRERPDPYTADTWRSRRSPSPARPAYASNDASGRDSAATSRRSSPPPIHPSRAALVEDRPVREPASAPRSPFRERLPDRGRDYSRERERSPPRRRDSPPTGPRGDRDFAPPTGPSSSSYRNGDSNFARAPPTGPSSRSYPSPAISPPVGPSSLTPQAPSFPRGNNPVLAAPTRPRGGGRGGFGGYEGRGDFSGPSSRRGSWGAGPRGGGYYGGAPSGPRGSSSGPSGAAPFAPSFRGSNNSTATTYPRTMRFRDHLSDLPKEIPGGQRAPELYDKSKILKLEAEAQKLREMIDKKEDAKRQKLREWDSLEREADTAQLRVDLAEGSLRSINGEADVSDAF
ncbi:hypothetical protein BKA58DRAFT_440761 [Alternaria rosae]|uniref:uncharacterized protein n=1 Tax=Alternaria rosae TaxID=1187941 RepID=UPI001E8E5054|nr:uncharacterized protein BKA58DRAFT_440761 [Alternaria rosae]KAH6868310.1 hypothetical protein BKA58DRAFT_440761 [Alternaria rosae]